MSKHKALDLRITAAEGRLILALLSYTRGPVARSAAGKIERAVQSTRRSPRPSRSRA